MLSVKSKLHQFVTKNKKILKDTGFLFVSGNAQKILGIITIFVLVRHFPQESYGEYSFVMSVAALASIFSISGIGNSLIQSISRGFNGTYRASLKYTMGGSCIASLILLGFAISYYSLDHYEMAISFLLLTIFIPFTQGLSYWKSVYSGQEKFMYLSILMFCMDTLKSGSIILLVIYNEPKIYIPIFVLCIIPTLMNIYYTYITLKNIPKEAEVEQGSIQYGLKTTLFSCVNVVANKADALLIYAFLSPVSLAIYAVSDRISEVIKEGVNDIGLILAPKFAKRKSYTADLNKILKYFSILISLGILFFAFFIAPKFIEIVLGQDYLPAIPYTQVLLISISIAIFQNLKLRFIMSQLDSDSFRRYIIYTSIARIIFSIAMVPFLGIWGAVISTVFYRIFSVLYIEWIMKNKYKVVE